MDEHELVPAECVQPRVVAQHGCADASGVCAAAFDPCQRTLALARDDGRIQLFGGSAAEECTLASSCAAPTVALRFLRHAPYLLRVSLQSELELWDLRTCSLEACALWPGELTSVCVLPGSPFVLVGEDDGTLRCACVRNGVIEPREFALTHERLGAALPSALVALALQPDAKDGRVLVAHAGGSVCLLDLATREPVLLASCGAGLTGCAWVDSMMFASAHAGGHLRLWSLPEAAAPWRATPPQPAAACASAGTLLGDGDGDVALLGTSARGGVLAAQCGDTAYAVYTTRAGDGPAPLPPPLPLPGVPGGLRLLVAAFGCDPEQLVALAARQEGVEPCIFVRPLEADAAATPWAGVPLGFPAATVSCAMVMAGVAPLLRVLRDFPHASPSVLQLPQCTPRDGAGASAARLLVTGHADGAVRLCDASHAGLPVLATITASAPVSCIDVCATAALCVVCTANSLSVHAVDGVPAQCGAAQLETEPLCVALATAGSCVAVGHASGSVTTLDLPACATAKTQQLLPPDEAVVALLAVHSADAGQLLLALGATSSVGALSLGTGRTSTPCRAEAAAAALAIFALDAAGAPVTSSGATLPAHPRAPLTDAAEQEDDLAASLPGPAATVIVCAEDAARIHLLAALLQGAQRAERQHQFRVPLLRAQIFVAPGAACLAVLDRALTLIVLDAALLRPIAQVAFPSLVREQWPGATAALFAAGLDGHVFTVWADSRGEPLPEALRLELLEEFSAPEPPPEPPCLWDRTRALAEASEDKADEEAGTAEAAEESDAGKRRGVFGGKLGGLRANVARHAKTALQRVGMPGFKPRKVLTPGELEDLFPRPQQPQPAPARTRLVVEGRAELLGPKPALRTADEIRERYGRPAKPADVAGALGENLDKLRERGEKLNTLQDKTQRLESQAQDFAASAAKLREQQEAKSFFGLFS